VVVVSSWPLGVVLRSVLVLPLGDGAGSAEVWPGSLVCPGLVVDLPDPVDGVVVGLLACPGEDCDLPGLDEPSVCGDSVPFRLPVPDPAGGCAGIEECAVSVGAELEAGTGRL
jgi:hypothetical protein